MPMSLCQPLHLCQPEVEKCVSAHHLDEGWKVVSTTSGSGARDDNSYWLVVLQK